MKSRFLTRSAFFVGKKSILLVYKCLLIFRFATFSRLSKSSYWNINTGRKLNYALIRRPWLSRDSPSFAEESIERDARKLIMRDVLRRNKEAFRRRERDLVDRCINDYCCRRYKWNRPSFPWSIPILTMNNAGKKEFQFVASIREREINSTSASRSQS